MEWADRYTKGAGHKTTANPIFRISIYGTQGWGGNSSIPQKPKISGIPPCLRSQHTYSRWWTWSVWFVPLNKKFRLKFDFITLFTASSRGLQSYLTNCSQTTSKCSWPEGSSQVYLPLTRLLKDILTNKGITDLQGVVSGLEGNMNNEEPQQNKLKSAYDGK